MTQYGPDPEVREALLLIAEAVGSMPRPRSGGRWELVTQEAEGRTRLTVMSDRALLHVAGRVRAHNEWRASAHFWELWDNNGKFKL